MTYSRDELQKAANDSARSTEAVKKLLHQTIERFDQRGKSSIKSAADLDTAKKMLAKIEKLAAKTQSNYSFRAYDYKPPSQNKKSLSASVDEQREQERQVNLFLASHLKAGKDSFSLGVRIENQLCVFIKKGANSTKRKGSRITNEGCL